MGRGAFAGLNPFTWLNPNTYIEIHRQHERQPVFEFLVRAHIVVVLIAWGWMIYKAARFIFGLF